MPNNIDFIEIEGYKSIKKARIDLKPINILIGANGSGKSNFLSFFDFLNALYEQRLQIYVLQRGGQDFFIHQGLENSDQIVFKVQFEEGMNTYEVALTSTSSGLRFLREHIHYFDYLGENISNRSSESFLKNSNSSRKSYMIARLEKFRKYHFHDTGPGTAFGKTSNINSDQFFLYSDGHNIAAYLHTIKRKDDIIYQRIISTIQSIAPYFNDFFLEPNENGYIQLFWKDNFSEKPYSVFQLSDGTVRFIALATLFLQPKLPGTIVIDEPELGLHPAAIRLLASMIKSAAQRGCQVIAATQSVELLNQFEPEDIITVDQRNGQTVFERLDNKKLKHWLEDFTLGELWEQNIIRSGQP